MIDQLENTNRTGMEHALLLVITVGSKYIAIDRAHSGDMIINSNQASACIYRRGRSDRDIFIGSLNSCTEIR